MSLTPSNPDASAPSLLPGDHFGPYVIVRRLAEGGMGTVYEARRRDIDSRVALKILTTNDAPEHAQRFLGEAKIAATIDHPNVASCVDFGDHEGRLYLALEYLDGETLAARMKRGPIDVAEALDLLLPMCDALATAHELAPPVVHRDVKPENIFLASRLGRVVPKLLDFGIAKQRPGASLDAGPTLSAAILGTPRYMAPEQARHTKSVGPAADQFSFGVVLWECITGRQLFTGDTTIEVLLKIVNDPVPSLREVLPAAPERLDVAVMRLLEKSPDRRFASMREVGDALLPFATEHARQRWVEARPRSPRPEASAPPRVDPLGQTHPPAEPPHVSPAAAIPPTIVTPTARDVRYYRLGVPAALAGVALLAWRLFAPSPTPVMPLPRPDGVVSHVQLPPVDAGGSARGLQTGTPLPDVPTVPTSNEPDVRTAVPSSAKRPCRRGRPCTGQQRPPRDADAPPAAATTVDDLPPVR